MAEGMHSEFVGIGFVKEDPIYGDQILLSCGGLLTTPATLDFMSAIEDKLC